MNINFHEHITGIELIAKLRAEKPGLRAILTSGYSGDSIAAAKLFLQKPYRMETLLTIVKDALGNPPD